MRVQSLGWEDSLEEGMATHSSILTWKIPWIDLEDVQSEMSQAKKKYHMISFLCGI